MITTEYDFVQKIIPTFSIYFNVTQEVWSKCKTGRIDLLLQSKTEPNVFFGIECKLPDSKRGEKIGEFVKQAIRYSNLEFDLGNGRYLKIPILICPPLSYKYFLLNEEEAEVNDNNYLWHRDRHNKDHEHHTFNGFLGAFNVGEVRSRSNNSWYFVMSNKLLFDSDKKYFQMKEDKGLHLANYELTIKKINK